MIINLCLNSKLIANWLCVRLVERLTRNYEKNERKVRNFFTKHSNVFSSHQGLDLFNYSYVFRLSRFYFPKYWNIPSLMFWNWSHFFWHQIWLLAILEFPAPPPSAAPTNNNKTSLSNTEEQKLKCDELKSWRGGRERLVESVWWCGRCWDLLGPETERGSV